MAEEDGATVVAVSSHSRRLSEIFGGEGVDVALVDGLGACLTWEASR